MGTNTWHFSNARLHVSPQTRISSVNSPGFMSKEEAIKFLDSIAFSYTLYFLDENNIKQDIIRKQ